MSTTYRIARVLYKGVAAGLAAESTGLVKEVVETGELPKFREGLDEGVSGKRKKPVTDRFWRGLATHSSTVGWRLPT